MSLGPGLGESRGTFVRILASSQFGVDVESVLCVTILQRKSVVFLSLVAAASAFQAGTFFAPVGAAGKRCGDPPAGLSYACL